MRVLAMSGSLRRGSFNTAAIRAAIELAPPEMTITQVDISDLPLFNDDARLAGYPEPAARLRQQVRDADALLLASPEYNYSVSGVLKNAFDWVSRPPEQPFAGKPGAIMGASTGLFGTARGQAHLRQICHAVDIRLVNRPEIMITQASQKFDEAGRLTDEKARELVKKLLISLQQLTEQLRE